MFEKKDLKDVSFYGVALFLIIIGAILFAYGAAGFLLNIFWIKSIALPMFKVIGGSVVFALGYIILELEALRAKK